MTQEQTRRTQESLNQTYAMIEKLQNHSPKFQDRKLIAEYMNHATKLEVMLNGTTELLENKAA